MLPFFISAHLVLPASFLLTALTDRICCCPLAAQRFTTTEKEITMPSVYEVITARIIEQLEFGTAPWQKP